MVSALSGVGKVLVVVGVLLIVVGLLFTFWERIPYLERLPVDVVLGKGSLRVFVPVVTCITISLILTIVLNILLRFWR